MFDAVGAAQPFVRDGIAESEGAEGIAHGGLQPHRQLGQRLLPPRDQLLDPLLGVRERRGVPDVVEALLHRLAVHVARDVIERVAEIVHLTALVHRVGKEAMDRIHQPGVFIGDDIRHAGQSPLQQLLEHAAPAEATLRRVQPHAQMLPVAIGPDADDPQHRGAAHLALPPHPLDVRVDHQVRIRLGGQRSRPPDFEIAVEAPDEGTHFRGGHAGATERLQNRRHLPGRDALEVHLGQREHQRLFTSLVPGEQTGLKPAGAIPGDLQFELPHPRRELAATEAVPDLAPVRRAFKPLRPDELGELALDRFVDQRRQHGAQRIGGDWRTLRERQHGGILRGTGHRLSPGLRGAQTPLVDAHPEDER